MKIFNGKKAARKILKDLAGKIKSEKIHPVLAVILVGDDEASLLYIKLKKEAGKKTGVRVDEYIFDRQTKEGEVIFKIQELNQDESVSGIIVQLPLPTMLNADRIIDAISPIKDVDGFHKKNREFLEKNEARVLPVLPSAILAATAEALKNDFSGKKILALVSSEIFGHSLKMVLEKQGADIDYMVRKTCIVLGAEKEIKNADVLITVCGCPNFIKGDMIKDGVILIDAGITRYSGGKVVGDVNRESVKAKAAFLTPVPGGIGPVTVALLLKNVYLAAKR